MTTLASPISTRPSRWWTATAQSPCRSVSSSPRPGEHRLGHLLVGLVLEVEDVAAARAAADGADEARDRAGLGILDLAQHGRDVERAFDEAERAAADGRDDRHLVAVRELMPRLDVLPVDGVEQPRRLVAETEGGPDVLDAGDVVELETRAPGAFPEAGEEADGDAHALILPAASGAEVALEQRAGLRPQVGAEPVGVVALLDQHEAGLAQDREVVVRGRLREADLLGRIRERDRPGLQPPQQLQPALVAQRLVDADELGRIARAAPARGRA